MPKTFQKAIPEDVLKCGATEPFRRPEGFKTFQVEPWISVSCLGQAAAAWQKLSSKSWGDPEEDPVLLAKGTRCSDLPGFSTNLALVEL